MEKSKEEVSQQGIKDQEKMPGQPDPLQKRYQEVKDKMEKELAILRAKNEMKEELKQLKKEIDQEKQKNSLFTKLAKKIFDRGGL